MPEGPGEQRTDPVAAEVAAPETPAALTATAAPPAEELESAPAAEASAPVPAAEDPPLLTPPPEPAAAAAPPPPAWLPAEAMPVPPEPIPGVTEEALRIAEALVFASDRPIPAGRLAAALPEGSDAAAVLAALRLRMAGRGVELHETGGGFAFRTAPDLAPRLTKVIEAPRRLPRAAMESLAIIAYHQPCTRAEIEEIRGAALAQTTLESLLELGLVAPRGRKEVPGRPALWGTTPKFLEQFGLRALSDLPRREELVAPDAAPLPAAAAASPPPATPATPPAP